VRGIVAHHHELDPDLTSRVVEAEPPTFASDGPPGSPANQSCRGSQAVSSSSLLGTIVV
jgi:hypothetical protein